MLRVNFWPPKTWRFWPIERRKGGNTKYSDGTDCVILIDMATVIIVHPGTKPFVIVRSIHNHCVVAKSRSTVVVVLVVMVVLLLGIRAEQDHGRWRRHIVGQGVDTDQGTLVLIRCWRGDRESLRRACRHTYGSTTIKSHWTEYNGGGQYTDTIYSMDHQREVANLRFDKYYTLD